MSAAQNFGTFVIKMRTSSGTTIDVPSADLIECFFIEDIFVYALMGKLTFVDKVGLMELLPITGEESIGISFGEGEDKTELWFDIFSFGKVSQLTHLEGSATNLMEIYFVDQTFMGLTQARYSTSWTNTKVSDIVKNISERMIGVSIDEFDNFESSNEILPYFYMPYWSPLEAIKWLNERASGIDSGTAGYLYYHTSQDKWNYITIDKLFQNKVVELDDIGNPLTYKLIDSANPGYINTILSWQICPIDMSGLEVIRGGHRLGYDFSTKTLIDNEYTYKTSISEYTMMGRRTLYPDISSSIAGYSLEGESDPDLLDNIYYNKFIKRYSTQFGINVIVKGQENRRAGMMITVAWPSSIKSEFMHKSLEGKYLVQSITHQFSGRTQPPYRQRMVLLKNAYDDSDSKTLVKVHPTKQALEIATKKFGKGIPV